MMQIENPVVVDNSQDNQDDQEGHSIEDFGEDMLGRQKASSILFSYTVPDDDVKRCMTGLEAAFARYASWLFFGVLVAIEESMMEPTMIVGIANASLTRTWAELFNIPGLSIWKCGNGHSAMLYIVEHTQADTVIERGLRPKYVRGERNKRTVGDLMGLSETEKLKLSTQTYNALDKSIQIHELNKAKEKKESIVFALPLRNWQKPIVKAFDRLLNDRTIFFLIDLWGGAGKTTLLSQLGQQKNIDYLTIETKGQDLLFLADVDALNTIVDVERREHSKVDYSALAKLKGGQYTCGKYEGKRCARGPRNLFVVMNDIPDMYALSTDKYDIYFIAHEADDWKLMHDATSNIPSPGERERLVEAAAENDLEKEVSFTYRLEMYHRCMPNSILPRDPAEYKTFMQQRSQQQPEQNQYGLLVDL